MNDRQRRLPSRAVALQLAGAVATSVGVGVIDWPAGVIVAGVLCIGIGALAELSEHEAGA